MTTKIKTVTPIDTNDVKAPFIAVRDASKLTGIPARLIRKRINRVRIGNEDYVKVAAVNDLLLA